jgi:hypothetical protein
VIVAPVLDGVMRELVWDIADELELLPSAGRDLRAKVGLDSRSADSGLVSAVAS